MTAPALGIDPGKTGGACLLAGDGRHVLATWHWRPTGEGERAGYLLSSHVVDGSIVVGAWSSALSRVGERIAADVRGVLGASPDLVLVVEGLYVDPRWPATALELAEATGALVDPLRALATGEVLRPRASTWRPAVLGIAPSTAADRAEREAVRLVRAGLVRGLEELTDGHVAEAAAIARWGWVAARESAQLELLGGRR